MSVHMSEILEQIGWSNGFHVPIANAENQKLEAELERLTIRKSNAKASFATASSRLEALDKHLKFIAQEADQNQKLITAHKQHIEAEAHKLKLSQAEKDRVNQEIRQMNKNIEDIELRQNVRRNDLAKSLVKIEKLKSETTWDADALSAWEESLKKRDDDNKLLQKFAKEDEKKANELETKRQNLELEVVNKRATVTKMVAEITNYELVMERIGKTFKQQAEERTALVNQWQDAVHNLRQRDEGIEKTNKEIALTQEIIAQQKEALDEQNNFLANEQNNNRSVEEEISQLNLNNSRLRKDLNELIQFVLTFSSEVNNTKRAMASTGQLLEKERIKARNLVKEYHDMEFKITKANLDIEELQKKLNEVNASSMTASERAKSLEQLIDEETRQSNILISDSKRVQGVLYRSRIYFQELVDIAKGIEVEISGCEMSTRLLEKRIKVTVNELNMQKEMILGLDYRINELEVQISNLEGKSKIDEETEILNTKIAELEHILAGHNETKNFLQGQVIRLEDEMRRLGIAIAADSSRIEALRGKLQDQILLFEGGIKQAAAAKLRSQQRQVEENVLRLKVAQLNKAISKEEDSIYDLQKFRIELETALRERQIEINTHKEILFAQRKNLDEAKGRLRADVKGREIRIEQFQKKHHIALMTLGKDEDGQPLSITHFKIKSAQEKYMLQQQGDELDSKIKTAEKEIIAMENTLKIVNMTNATYKQSLSPIDEESEENIEMKQLEQEIMNMGIVLRQNRKRLHIKQQTIKELNETSEDLYRQQVEVADELNKIQSEYSNLTREEELRKEKIKNTCRHMKSLKKHIKQSSLEKPERNLEIRQLQDVNKCTLQQLAEISTRHQEITPLITRYISEHNLQLPGSRPKYSTSSSSISSLSHRSVTSSSSTGTAVSQVVLTFDSGASMFNKKI